MYVSGVCVYVCESEFSIIKLIHKNHSTALHKTGDPKKFKNGMDLKMDSWSGGI